MKKIFIVLSLLLTITMSVFLMTACSSPAASPETSLKGADNLGDCVWNLVFRKMFPKELTLK